MSRVYEYYLSMQEELDEQWQDYVYENDWGSGEDKITITDDMFFEFVEEKMEKVC
jgi:hypothetical protein